MATSWLLFGGEVLYERVSSAHPHATLSDALGLVSPARTGFGQALETESVDVTRGAEWFCGVSHACVRSFRAADVQNLPELSPVAKLLNHLTCSVSIFAHG
jgi:hypothetical protein